MAFRKRNVAVNNAVPSAGTVTSPSGLLKQQIPPGIKPSSRGSSNVTSTGTSELDALLGGHGGLSLGSSLLIGEHGTTDYSGALLRAYVAEGLLQGHQVHVVGVGKAWTQNLPGVSSEGEGKHSSKGTDSRAQEEKMKIAWRYENMERASSRGLPVRSTHSPTTSDAMPLETPFCHTFDLAKRLESSPDHKINHISIGSGSNPFTSILAKLASSLASSTPSIGHRVVIPLMLSPLYYPISAAEPAQALGFLHGLRALLRRHSAHTTAMISMPLSLFPRRSGLVRWMEHLSDGVVEMIPFPYVAGASAQGDSAQGMLKIAKLPLTTDRGEGGAGAGNTIGDDLAFTLSRRKFVIEPFSLPPMEGDQEAQKNAGKVTAKDVEF